MKYDWPEAYKLVMDRVGRRTDMKMIELKRQLCPVQPLEYTELVSFRTKNYIGMYEYDSNQYVLIPVADSQLEMSYLGDPGSYDKLDEIVFETVGEHITHVSDDGHYHFVLECFGEVD